MASPGDSDFDPENGPDEWRGDDDGSSLKGSARIQLFRDKRTPTAGSNTSKYSFPTIPLRAIRRRTNGSQEGPDEEKKRASYGREFIEFLSEGQSKTASYLDACDWYVRFIDSKYRAHWHAIQPIVAGLNQEAKAPDADDTAKVDKVLATIAKLLSENKNFALSDPVDELINGKLIRDDETDGRPALNQLMFTFLGWLTMLYDPRLDCKPEKLQVAKFTIKTDGNKANLQSRVFDTQTQDLDYVDQALHHLLGRFGKVIPSLPLGRQSEVEFAPPSEWIVVPFVCYQTLRAVCRVEIEWVDALGMHLEFDSSRKVLKIFRFPSFCRLMYKHKHPGLLSQLIDDKENDIRDGYRRENEVVFTRDYFREMLLTYRLIFGQDAKSSRLFGRELAALASASKSKSKSRSQKARQPCVFALPDADPFLLRLCSLRADAPGAWEIYADINANSVQSYYTPQSYPFFAEKLLVLQAYVKEQHPHDWKTLWHDHRNKSNWWQFWAVLFIGGSTIILSVLSLVFQIWQAVLTEQQLVQGQQANLQPAHVHDI